MSQNTEQRTPSIKQAVLERIERESVEMVPQWRVTLKEKGVWVLWCMSVAAGAVAVVIIAFVEENAGWEFYEATHDNLLTFVVDTLPMAWFLYLAAFLIVSYHMFRFTKHGYRYSLTTMASTSAVVSVALGSILYVGGYADTIESVADAMPFHPSMQLLHVRHWSQAERGLFFGFAEQYDWEMGTLNFITADNRELTFDTSFLRGLSALGDPVMGPARIIATSSSDGSRLFACYVLPVERMQHITLRDLKTRTYDLFAINATRLLAEKRDGGQDSLALAPESTPEAALSTAIAPGTSRAMKSGDAFADTGVTETSVMSMSADSHADALQYEPPVKYYETPEHNPCEMMFPPKDEH